MPATLAVTPKSGTACKKLGNSSIYQGKKFTCVKSGKKLVWNKGTVLRLNKEPNPAPLPSPSISPTQTPIPIPIPIPTPSPSPTFEFTDSNLFLPINTCKLKDFSRPNNSGGISNGFPNPSALSGKKIIRSLALFVDYPDLVGGYDPSKVKIDTIDDINNFYEQISYGKLKFEWTVTDSFSRMPHEVGYYHLTRSTFQTVNPRDNLNFLEDAIRAGDPKVDYSKFDLVIIFGPKQATTQQIGEYPGTRSGSGIRVMSQEGQVRNIQTAVADGFRWGNTKLGYLHSAGLIHEIGHELGLVDLYLYPNNEPHLYGSNNLYSDLGGFEGFDFMYSLGAIAPEPIAWNRWLLDFIEDRQIACLDPNKPGIIKVESLSIRGAGTKAIVLPISQSEAIIIESRRSVGYDSAITKALEGALVYRLDTKWKTGQGPFGIVKKSNLSGKSPEEVLLRPGESLLVAGIRITNLYGTDNYDVISVERD